MQPKVKTLASPSDAVTPLEEESRKVAYRAAVESIVLLKNDGALPVVPGRIALYGAGAGRTVKGGVGSGEVNERHAITIEEGLEKGGFTVTTKSWLRDYDKRYAEGEEEYTRAFRKKLLKPSLTSLINLMNDPYSPPSGQPISQIDIDASNTEVGMYVVARQAGEGSDRRLKDNYLTDEERSAIALCAKRYDRFILVINVGSSFDMGFLDEIQGINAVIFYAQQGGMGGLALADLISGKESFSGKLADTWAMKYQDIPNAMDYSYLNDGLDEEYYKEGIYVGYRYFDTFGVAPRFPFGFGLSYTSFSHTVLDTNINGETISIEAAVTNTGEYPGKEVLQLYASCPQSKALPKEYQRLVAFAKTPLLQPGESARVTLTFDAEKMASYREADGATVLEDGEYILRLGNSSRNTAVCALAVLEKERIICTHQHICRRKEAVEEIKAPQVVYEAVSEDIPRLELKSHAIPTRAFSYGNPPIRHTPGLDKRLDKLSLDDRIKLVIGNGSCNKYHRQAPGSAGYTTGALLRKKIPNVALADGPAGLRLQKKTVQLKNGKLKSVEPAIAMMKYLPDFIKNFTVTSEEKGTLLYQFTTAFPVELALAQTWNTGLLEEMGKAISAEMSAYGVSYWLAPALNIHRNPLCGRNFEYYSEDPLLSGVYAAAVTKGVQSVKGNFTTVKHFACNNQEDNRNRTNANVNERALREIYLKGFEIAVKESQPGAVMSSYNKVNGVYTPNSYDLLTKVLRNEWGFEGFVMTDWYSTGKGLADNAMAIKAGNDLIMPGTAAVEKRIKKALKEGEILNTDIHRCSANVLRGILETAAAKEYYKGK